MNEQTNKQKSPCVLEDLSPSRPPPKKEEEMVEEEEEEGGEETRGNKVGEKRRGFGSGPPYSSY